MILELPVKLIGILWKHSLTLMNELNDTDNFITSRQPNELFWLIFYGDCEFKVNVNKRILIATIPCIKKK